MSLATVSAAAAGAELTGTVQVSGKPAQNAVIWLDAQMPRRGSRPSRVVLDQRNLTFSPHVLAVRVGTVVEFPNNDKVFHNVFSFRREEVRPRDVSERHLKADRLR